MELLPSGNLSQEKKILSVLANEDFADHFEFH